MLKPTAELDVTIAEGLEPGDTVTTETIDLTIIDVTEPLNGEVTITYCRPGAFGMRAMTVPAAREYHVRNGR